MKTWKLKIVVIVLFSVVGLTIKAQSYKDTEYFKDYLNSYQRWSIEDNVHACPEYYNIDGSHKVYAVDTISADRVKIVLQDRGLNLYAIIDTVGLIESKCDDILCSNLAYLLATSSFTFVNIPYAEKFNAFCDRYFYETAHFGDEDVVYIELLYKRQDYKGRECFYEYFDQHARIYCNHPYLEFPIETKPLYYMVFLMVGDTYNTYMKLAVEDFSEPHYAPVAFIDPLAYYRVLVPIFKEYE